MPELKTDFNDDTGNLTRLDQEEKTLAFRVPAWFHLAVKRAALEKGMPYSAYAVSGITALLIKDGVPIPSPIGRKKRGRPPSGGVSS
jgi:hypothetical protein